MLEYADRQYQEGLQLAQKKNLTTQDAKAAVLCF